jgi:putative aldouronate transport system permease protein
MAVVKNGFLREIKKNRVKYIMILPGVVLFLIFSYIPMGGIIMAFQNFNPARGLFNSPWVGLKHFASFFNSPDAFKIIRNTILLNVYGIVFGFPFPIIFALALNELKSSGLKRVIQTISCLPNFLSNVIIVGIVVLFLSPERGLLNMVLSALGFEKIYFLIEPAYFRSIYTIVNIWRGFGWGAIIYLAAIVGISPELYESAVLDGASRFQRIIYITLPSIKSTIVISLILSLAGILGSNFEMVYLIYNPLTYEVSDVIGTYVYRRGLAGARGIPEYSFGAAVGLFNSVVGFILVIISNRLSRKIVGTSIS